MSQQQFRLTSAPRSLAECVKPVFHYSIGMPAEFGQQSVFYRAPTLAEKREVFRHVVAFNMRRGNVGQVRALRAFACAESARITSDMRDAFRKAWSMSRNAQSL